MLKRRCIILGLILVGPWIHAASGRSWFPSQYDPYPRNLADRHEPRLGLTWHGNNLGAALGGPVVILTGGRRPTWGLTLEGLANLGLTREGSFFPLETVDGYFLLGGELALDSWRAKIRVAHWSSHKADGDTTVAYRDQTFSREWASLELGRFLSGIFLYGRLGAAWHAVPESPGLKTGAGLLWELNPEKTGPFYAAHIQTEAAQSYRLDQSHMAGWKLGAQNRYYVALRYYRGFRPVGQYLNQREDFLGFEIQFQPYFSSPLLH